MTTPYLDARRQELEQSGLNPTVRLYSNPNQASYGTGTGTAPINAARNPNGAVNPDGVVPGTPPEPSRELPYGSAYYRPYTNAQGPAVHISAVREQLRLRHRGRSERRERRESREHHADAGDDPPAVHATTPAGPRQRGRPAIRGRSPRRGRQSGRRRDAWRPATLSGFVSESTPSPASTTPGRGAFEAPRPGLFAPRKREFRPPALLSCHSHTISQEISSESMSPKSLH